MLKHEHENKTGGNWGEPPPPFPRSHSHVFECLSLMRHPRLSQSPSAFTQSTCGKSSVTRRLPHYGTGYILHCTKTLHCTVQYFNELYYVMLYYALDHNLLYTAVLCDTMSYYDMLSYNTPRQSSTRLEKISPCRP